MPSPVTPPPPMSTSSLPPSAKPFRVPPAPADVKPPILASDILREEVAPRAPAKRAIRLSLAAFAATFAVGALAARGGVGPVRLEAPGAFEGALGTAFVAAAAAVAPLSYGTRAALAVLAGAVPLAMGAARIGPLAAMVQPGHDGTVTAGALAVMATLLPAALVFRARYRAFSGARAILGTALAAAAPGVALLAMRAADPAAPPAARAIAALGVASAAASTLGFMGPETSAGCAQWAALVVGAVVARPIYWAISAAWSGQDVEMIASTAAALGELLATTLVTFGLFQLLAAAFGGQARQVDVHRAVGAGASEPSGAPE